MFTTIVVLASVIAAGPKWDEEVERRFLVLEEQWTKECLKVSSSSNLRDYVQQPGFLAIVALGPPAIPHVIKRLEQTLEDKKLRDAGRVPKFDPCPWECVFLEITKYRLNEDAKYRDKVRRYFEKLGQPDLNMIFDPNGVSYIPEIAIPHLIQWWDKAGRQQFGMTDPKM